MGQNLETGGRELGKIHRKSNDKKFFCYFTGFLEGIASSGCLEFGEVEPLIAQCEDFVANIGDGDAFDLLEDFKVDLLEHDTVLNAIEYRVREIDLSCSKSSINRIYGFFAGIACDDLITIDEAKELVERVSLEDDLLKDPLVAAVVYTCIDAIEDDVIDNKESQEICTHISRLVGDCYADTGLSALGNVPVFDPEDAPDRDDLDGLRFVLTGEFSIRPRSKMEDEIQALGGKTAKGITKDTNYLIVASQASRDWVTTHRGNKIIKAEEYRLKYGKLAYLSESSVKKMLGM